MIRTYNRDVDYQETEHYEWSNIAGSGSGSGGSSGSGSGGGSGGGSGCGSNSGSSGTSSSNWSDSYDETVSYPGFYGGAYYSSYGYGSGGGYAGDEPLDYIGDDFSYSSGSGYASYGYGDGGYFLYSQGDQQSTWLDDGSDLSASRLTDNGQDQRGEFRGNDRSAREREHPGRGRSAEHHRSPVWSHWDTLDQLFAVAPPEPAIRYEVDAAGNLLSVTDVLGHRAAYTYDAGGQVTSVTDPNGHTTFFVYDSSGDLAVLIDPLGTQTAWTYDDAGQVTREQVTIDGVVLNRTFDYDDGGNLVRSVDRNGRVRVFVWDDDQRLHQEIWYNTVADADLDADLDVDRQNTITWTYDQAGNLASVVDNFSSYFYVYDTSDRVTTQIVSNAGGPVTVLTTDYGERLDDRPVSRSATVDGVPDFVNLYEYDDQDRLIALTQTGQGAAAVADKLVTFDYNDNGQFVTITRYASLDGSQLVAVSDYTYDQYGRPTSLVHHQNPAAPLAEYTWTWEGGGDTVEVVQAGAASGPQFGAGWMLPFGGTVYTSRELEISALPNYVWTFDTAFIGHLVQTTSTDGTVDYQYDAEGNRTRRIEIATDEVTEYHWDHRNRLVRVGTRTTDNGPLTTDTQYAYDYLNRWIARSHDPDGDGPLGFTDTYFVYDGTPPSGSLLDCAAVTMENIGQIVLHFETDGQGDLQLAHRYLWGPAVDQILADAQVTDPTAPGNIVWPLTDQLNTVRDLAIYDADTDTTTIINHLIYDAYGRITSQSAPDQTTLFAFTARPFDQATGLQNNLNR